MRTPFATLRESPLPPLYSFYENCGEALAFYVFTSWTPYHCASASLPPAISDSPEAEANGERSRKSHRMCVLVWGRAACTQLRWSRVL